jgi:hypothetical protein
MLSLRKPIIALWAKNMYFILLTDVAGINFFTAREK